MNDCTAFWMALVEMLGGLTLTVTGLPPVVRPASVSVTPGIAFWTVFDEEVCQVLPPSVEYLASVPAWLDCCTSAPALSETVNVLALPVVRSEKTMLLLTTVAQTLPFWSALTALARSWAVAPALRL